MSTTESTRPLDVRGRRRSPATLPGYRTGQVPANKGRRYAPHVWNIEDIDRLLKAIQPRHDGDLEHLNVQRLPTIIVVLWRTGMRISELVALEPRDFDRREMTIVIRRGKGDKRRVVTMNEWGWEHLEHWLELRRELPLGQVFCVLSGPTSGRGMYATEVRRQLREAGRRAGLDRQCNPHSFRHTAAVEWMRAGVPMEAARRALGHERLDVTQAYLRSIDDREMLAPISALPTPMVPLRM